MAWMNELHDGSLEETDEIYIFFFYHAQVSIPRWALLINFILS